MLVLNVDKEQAIDILRGIDEEDWESTVPNHIDMTEKEQRKAFSLILKDIKVGGWMYSEAVRFCNSQSHQLQPPVQVNPIRIELEEGVNTQWRRCHQNVNACIEKFGGYKVMGYVIRRDKRSLLVGDLHSVWVDSRGVFGEPGKMLDVTPDNLRETCNSGYRLFTPFNIEEGGFTNAPSYFLYPTTKGGIRLAKNFAENEPCYLIDIEEAFIYQACPKMCDANVKEVGFKVLFLTGEKYKELMKQMREKQNVETI